MSNYTTDSTAGCLDTQMIEVDYHGPIFHNADGKCYEYDTNGNVKWFAHYGYNPGLALGIIFLALNAILLLEHIGLTFKAKRAWLIVTAVGALTEVIGWAGRTLSAHDNTGSNASGNYFLIQIVCLTIAPAFFSAAIYGLFIIIIDQVDPSISRFNPRKLVYFFVASDIAALALQAGGGGIAAGATTKSANDQGTHIMVGGIAFQLCVMIVFSCIALDYLRTCRKNGVRKPAKNLLILIAGVAVASVMIIVRGIYRTAELAEGWNGYIITHEIYFLIFDAALMIICLAALAITHPAFTAPQKRTPEQNALMEMRQRTTSQETAALSPEQQVAAGGQKQFV